MTVYIVQYNDCYGVGYDKYIEGYVTSEEEFLEWLKKHNEVRVAEGNGTESAEEFDLIRVDKL